MVCPVQNQDAQTSAMKKQYLAIYFTCLRRSAKRKMPHLLCPWSMASEILENSDGAACASFLLSTRESPSIKGV
jgi:hypothetical protein